VSHHCPWPGVLAAAFFAAPWLAWLGWRSRGYRRVPLKGPLCPPWQPTAEVFLDPVTGKAVRVWTTGKSGDRAYVEDSRVSGGNPDECPAPSMR